MEKWMIWKNGLQETVISIPIFHPSNYPDNFGKFISHSKRLFLR